MEHKGLWTSSILIGLISVVALLVAAEIDRLKNDHLVELAKACQSITGVQADYLTSPEVPRP